VCAWCVYVECVLEGGAGELERVIDNVIFVLDHCTVFLSPIAVDI